MPAVTTYLEREQKLCPVEVRASATFEDMVVVASNIMGCPCMLRTDTRFPLRTYDHILFATEQDIHLEQMKLEALRAEDEMKIQQKQNAIQWTMEDVPPRSVSRECLTLEQAFNVPRPESVSKWGEEVEVKFEDISGTQGSQPSGYVYQRRVGEQWDKAASDAFGIPMQITDPRTEIAAGDKVILKCKPIFGLDDMTAPISAPNRRQFQVGKSFPVRIKLQSKDRMVPLEVLNSAPPGQVEFQARIHFGVSVEFNVPKPTSLAPGKIYQMRRVKTNQASPPSSDMNVKMTMKYSVVRYSIPNVIIPRESAARDVVNAWWEAVDRNQVKDPNIVCLSRDPEMYEFQNEAGESYFDIEDGMEVFLVPTNKTSPEVVTIDVTWDGFDKDGLPLRLSISPTVHREAPRSRLLAMWLEHYKAQAADAEIASHMFTDENEYYWKDHTGAETAPPWTPGQQVIFKMKPWLKDNTEERQRKRPRPPPPTPSGRERPIETISGTPRIHYPGGLDRNGCCCGNPINSANRRS
jgi:hypothetical protein